MAEELTMGPDFRPEVVALEMDIGKILNLHFGSVALCMLCADKLRSSSIPRLNYLQSLLRLNSCLPEGGHHGATAAKKIPEFPG
jgi:hypothetical protein